MTETYTWKNFSQSSLEIQKQILDELEKTLPDMTWKQQAETFEGAPAEATLKFLGSLAWEAQVDIYKNRLPVKARPVARKLLCYEAEQKLRVKGKKYCLA